MWQTVSVAEQATQAPWPQRKTTFFLRSRQIEHVWFSSISAIFSSSSRRRAVDKSCTSVPRTPAASSLSCCRMAISSASSAAVAPASDDPPTDGWSFSFGVIETVKEGVKFPRTLQHFSMTKKNKNKKNKKQKNKGGLKSILAQENTSKEPNCPLWNAEKVWF